MTISNEERSRIIEEFVTLTRDKLVECDNTKFEDTMVACLDGLSNSMTMILSIYNQEDREEALDTAVVEIKKLCNKHAGSIGVVGRIRMERESNG